MIQKLADPQASASLAPPPGNPHVPPPPPAQLVRSYTERKWEELLELQKAVIGFQVGARLAGRPAFGAFFTCGRVVCASVCVCAGVWVGGWGGGGRGVDLPAQVCAECTHVLTLAPPHPAPQDIVRQEGLAPSAAEVAAEVAAAEEEMAAYGPDYDREGLRDKARTARLPGRPESTDMHGGFNLDGCTCLPHPPRKIAHTPSPTPTARRSRRLWRPSG